MKYLLLIVLLFTNTAINAEKINFESLKDLNLFKCINKNDTIQLSDTYYKEGKLSLEWKYNKNSILSGKVNSHILLDTEKENKYGVTLWIYNEKQQNDSIRIEFLSPEGYISYYFGFKLCYKGWRACWINFKQMLGDKKHKKISSYRFISPNNKGRIFIDRLTFPETNINLRTTPDMQIPYNNSFAFKDLWHWCRVWEWEMQKYDFPLKENLTNQEIEELKLLQKRVTKIININKPSKKDREKAYSLFYKINIKKSENGFTGFPIVSLDEINKDKNEISLYDIEVILYGLALDYVFNNNIDAYNKYFTTWKYAIDQGFAYGSGMGTNHHYGYQVRNIYISAWLMRNEIQKSDISDDIISTLTFWSALQETRKLHKAERDGLLDSWHTLLIPRIISALMQKDNRYKVRELRGLSRWLSASLSYTPGTVGGIKIDGTTFHHGGFYPAYTTGMIAAIGQFIYITNDTEYEPNRRALTVFKSALETMRNCSNKYEWGIGIGGRHPFGGALKDEDINAFAYLALSHDFSGKGNSFDKELASEFLRLCKKETEESIFFRDKGIKPAVNSPEGFFVYNYGATGIFRRNDWMVTLKGYNTDVWGAEIYRKDNRFGRYQSYGSVQIMGYDSRIKSGFNQNGWDWNRLPGTTTIHLPFKLLNSPLKETTMAKSKENFAGCSNIDGMNGMFAIKLMERDFKSFTPDFVARKSVFCFDNRMIFLGSNISNSNNTHPTETTLFQASIQNNHDSIILNEKTIKSKSFSSKLYASNDNPVYITDNYNNHYIVKSGEVNIKMDKQNSLHEKNLSHTSGYFASAWINHGITPKNQKYEYVVSIKQNENKSNIRLIDSYKVLRCDSIAHIVNDVINNITAYAVFEDLRLDNDKLFLFIPKECMVMCRKDYNGFYFTVCDPNLNIKEKSYTTSSPSNIIKKEIIIKGLWHIYGNDIKYFYKNNNTVIEVNCKDGKPIKVNVINK